MQPIRNLIENLQRLATPEHYLFTPGDLRALFPNTSESAFKTLLSRAERRGHLARVCRGLYLYDRVDYPRGLVLFHAAARLRADGFNYISLETALSDAGAISQMPINWITVMSSGRTSTVGCSLWGTIAFVHTRKSPEAVASQLSYDERCHLWRASVGLAVQDMRDTRRSLDLVDWSFVRESA